MFIITLIIYLSSFLWRVWVVGFNKFLKIIRCSSYKPYESYSLYIYEALKIMYIALFFIVWPLLNCTSCVIFNCLSNCISQAICIHVWAYHLSLVHLRWSSKVQQILAAGVYSMKLCLALLINIAIVAWVMNTHYYRVYWISPCTGP